MHFFVKGNQPPWGGCDRCGAGEHDEIHQVAKIGARLDAATVNGPPCACASTSYVYRWSHDSGAAFIGNNVVGVCEGCKLAHPPFRADDLEPDAIAAAHVASRAGRTWYRIRVGKRWLATPLVCKRGGAILADVYAGAGLFDGPVRDGPDDPHGPAMSTGLARQLLNYAPKVYVKPLDGSPGFWSY